MSENKIMPTHTCFDDALEFVEMRLSEKKLFADSDELLVVHGIALAPEGERAGEPFAHAWVEEGDLAYQAGMLMGGKVWYGVQREEFYLALRIQRATRYTLREAWERNRESGHFGPWEPEYETLCAHGDTRVFQ